MQLWANNAKSTLSASIADTDTGFALQTGEGALFPAPSAGEFFKATLYEVVSGQEVNHEIVSVTARVSDTLTVVRAQEGTTARAYAAGTPVQLRVTAGGMDGVLSKDGGVMTGLLNLAAGSDIASASTVDLTAADGNCPKITGTTAVTAWTMNTGQQMKCIAEGALPLTYHATTNNIEGGASYTCTAGDIINLVKGLDGVIRVSIENYGTTQTLYVPATALLPPITNGAASIYNETTTNKNVIAGMAFDAAVQEYAQFNVVMPKSWNLGTVSAIFHWTHGTTTTNFGVVWGLQGVAISNDEALDAAFGTAQEVADTGGTTDDLYTSSSTPAITISGTPAPGDYINFRVYRDVADAGDTLAVDAVLLGVTLLYGMAGNSDA